MNYKAFVALMVFAISRDMLNMPVTKVIDLFKDFTNQLMQSPANYDVDRTVDILIWDAQQDIKLGHSYGVYDKAIMNL